MTAIRCRLCDSPDTTPYAAKLGYRIHRCSACANGFLVPPARDFDPTAIYRSGYHRKNGQAHSESGYDDYFALRPALERTFGKRLRWILENAPCGEPRRLLDVGCGPGFFLNLARPHFEVSGVELGTEAVEYARKEFGLALLDEPFRPGLFRPDWFSAVTLFDTIEHLEDPVGALRTAREILQPQGVLMLITGDVDSLAARLSGSRWHLLTPPEHLFYFSRRGLTRLLDSLGFEVLSASYPSGHFTSDYLLERLVKSLGLARGYLGLDRLRRTLRGLVLPMNLFDIMLITARRRD